jgi:hypothetical protein
MIRFTEYKRAARPFGKTAHFLMRRYCRELCGRQSETIPLLYGMGATENAVSATITRQLSKNTRLLLKYGYFNYRDVTSGGHNNYQAHSLFSSLQIRF